MPRPDLGWTSQSRGFLRFVLTICALCSCLFTSTGRTRAWGQEVESVEAAATPDDEVAVQNDTNDTLDQQWARTTYTLGPDDQITVRAQDCEELNEKSFRVDLSGFIRFPLVGRVRVASMTVTQLEDEVTRRLKTYLLHPDVSISVNELRSQPVSVLGAVRNAGVYQLNGRKTVVEMLSLAGGLDQTAGGTVRIARRQEWGRIPLKDATTDPSGRLSVAELSLKAILQSNNPEHNIEVKPQDVITVSKAELVYVIGQVQRPGGFPLSERDSTTVLQALSLAGGLDRTASPKRARILRPMANAPGREEIAVNIKAIMDGKKSDVELRPEDILFIPSSMPKRAVSRAAEAAIQVGTGIAVWGR